MATVEQFGWTVSAFTSQYGGENGISYTVTNLAGPLNIYPGYGDFTQACVFRTYGPWWKICPSAAQPIGRKQERFISEDYAELCFQEKVRPARIEIFETYNPGCVVKILACDSVAGTDVDTGQVKWVTLWEGQPQWSQGESRVFSPPLRPVSFYTDLIRLEFSHILCDYYTELDGVKLIGKPCEKQCVGKSVEDLSENNEDSAVENFQSLPNDNTDSFCGLEPPEDLFIGSISENPSKHSSRKQSDENTSKISVESNHRLGAENDSLKSSVQVPSESKKCSQDVIKCNSAEKCDNTEHCASVEEITSKLSHIECSDVQETGVIPGEEQDASGFFSCLPEEVVQLILSYLDTASLCRMAQTCRLLSTHCYDPMQFTELNLKPFWATVNDASLRSLVSRCSLCQALDLSWCGNHGLVTVSGLEALLTVCGSRLTCLRLGNCGSVNAVVTARIAAICPTLQELDLQSCPDLGSGGFRVLAGLSDLRRLNLYRTQVDLTSIIQIVRGCRNLEHLNLGSCINMSLQDRVLSEIANHCPNLKSLDLWRWKSVSEIGISAIATSCPHLQEIDLGWVSSLRSSSGCYRKLAYHCRQLRKLVFTANRSVCDEDLEAIARCCPDLQQLDILGTGEVSLAAAQRILDSCKKLKFFDVSFCRNISFSDVKSWLAIYPHVNIKQSFQR